MFYLPLAGAIAVGDQVLKSRIEKEDPENFPRPVLHTKGTIWLYRNHNAGFPFGVLERHQELVRLLPLTVTSGLAGALLGLLSRPGETGRKLGLAFVIGGSGSNLYDRFTRGYVVDYFSIRAGKLKEVVLNLGDLFVFTGAAVLFLCDMAGGIRRKSR